MSWDAFFCEDCFSIGLLVCANPWGNFSCEVFVAKLFFAPKSPARKVHFFEKFNDFSPVENFFELSTSYQQCKFFDAVF